MQFRHAYASNFVSNILGNDALQSKEDVAAFLWFMEGEAGNDWEQTICGAENVVVEIGAFDGTTYSNSMFFEKSLGWKSILIEVGTQC